MNQLCLSKLSWAGAEQKNFKNIMDLHGLQTLINCINTKSFL
jgi:hypothetical protein